MSSLFLTTPSNQLDRCVLKEKESEEFKQSLNMNWVGGARYVFI